MDVSVSNRVYQIAKVKLISNINVCQYWNYIIIKNRCGRCSPADADEIVKTLRPIQDRRHFADDIFTCIFFNENCCILIKFSLKYVCKDPIDDNRALVQIMDWRRSGDKPLSEPMMISLPTHICVTRLQWVNNAGDRRQTVSTWWIPKGFGLDSTLPLCVMWSVLYLQFSYGSYDS